MICSVLYIINVSIIELCLLMHNFTGFSVNTTKLFCWDWILGETNQPKKKKMVEPLISKSTFKSINLSAKPNAAMTGLLNLVM